jgi:two-component system, NtrC family, sensor kinase
MKRARPLRLLLALILTAAAVVWGGLSFERKVATFQPLGFQAEVPGGFARVIRVEDAGTALRPGDQVLLVDGAEVAAPPELARRLKAKDESHLTVLRAGSLVEVAYHRPPLAVDFPYVLLALISVGYLLIGLYTLLRQGGRQGFLFYVWCLASALLYLLTPVPPADALYRWVYGGDELARLLLPALTLHLFLVFPAPLARRFARAIPFVYLPAAVFAALQLDLFLFHGRFLFGRPTAGAFALLDQWEIAHLVLFGLASIAILLWRLARPPEGALGHLGTPGWQQRQLRWIVFGMAGGYLPFFVLYVTPLLLGLRRPALLTTMAVLPLALVPLAFAYAILRYKLWDIEVIVRDTISTTLTLFLGVIGFSLANLLIVRGVPQDLAVARNLLSFTAGLGIAALLVPTRRGLSSALERLHYRSTFGKRRALSGLGRELLLERDLGQLCSALLKQIEEGVAIERLNLYLVQGESLVAVRPEGRLPRSLPLDVLGEELWDEEVRRISGVALPTEPMPAAQHLFLAGYRYAFPLTVLGSRVGVALAGYKADQNPLNSEDVELVRHLLNQAALAIENAQLLGRLQDQLQEVIRLKRYTEGIFESSPAGIAVLDPEGRIVSANAAFAALAGRERADLAGLPLAQVLPVELPPIGGGPTEVSYCGVGGSNNEERYLQLSLADFSGQEIAGVPPTPADADGRLRILVVHDVSDRVAMENALKEKDRLAALGMLAAGVAHEVNTPITGISSYAQMLLSDTAESDPRYDLLKKVERQTFRAARIVNNLLEYARNKSGERGPVALTPVIGEAIELMGDRLARRGIAVDFRRPEGEVTVIGCDGELQQVFTNLVANAADAMEAGGRLTVSVETDGGRARVAVADTGPGIPPERLEKIFQPFFSTKLTRGGTGLGLSISYDIVRRHGGDLKASSRPGEGACFVVELPLQPQVAA